MSYHDREPLRILWCSASQRAGSLYTGLAGCAAEMLDLHAPREYGSFQEFAKK